MSVPAGVIIAWPGAVGDIPAGWDRVAAFNNRFPIGATGLGTTGGSETHVHTSIGIHAHSAAHTHGVTSGSLSAAGENANYKVATPDYYSPTSRRSVALSHAHSINTNVGSVAGGGGCSVAAKINWDAQSNVPEYDTVVWIQSDGTPDGMPDGAICFCAEILTDWTAVSQGKFLRGATVGSDGGGSGGVLAGHSHTAQASHTHTVGSHLHNMTSLISSTYTSGALGSPIKSEGSSAVRTVSHNHSISIDYFSESPASPLPFSAVTPETEEYANFPNPYHMKLWQIRNDTGGDDYQVGMIALWIREAGPIPDGWVICNGANGTPALLGNVFVKGASGAEDIGDYGGAEAIHNHTAIPHTHSAVGGAHTHSFNIGTSAPRWLDLGSTYTNGMKAHVHTCAVLPPTALASLPTESLGGGPDMCWSSGDYPPFHRVYFIQCIDVPVETKRREVTISDCNTLGVVIGHVDLSLPGLEIIECDTIPGHDLNHYVPGSAPWATIDDAGIALQRYGSGLVMAVIPDSPGDCHIVSVDRNVFDENGGAIVIAGSWATVAMEVDSRLSFLVAMLLEGDGGAPEVFRWHHSVGQWDPTLNAGAGGWDFTTPVECDTDPTGSFPNALAGSNGSIRRLPDGSYLFAMIDDAEDMRIFECRDMSIDGSGTWAEV